MATRDPSTIREEGECSRHTVRQNNDSELKVSMPSTLRYLYEQIGEWIPTFASLGVSTGDPASGNTTGAYLSTGAIKTDDQTRSYARPGYTPRMRNNLDILTGYQVTRINFDQSNGSTTATGVSFQSSRDSQTYTVQANNEVILSAGVIGSPRKSRQILKCGCCTH